MRGVHIYNILNGVFYFAFGLWGMILPKRILAFFDVQAHGIYALHNIRAIWAGLAMLGVIMLWKSRSSSAVMMAMIIALVTGAVVIGRFLGLAFDGMDAGAQATYLEIAFELSWVIIGLFFVKRALAQLKLSAGH